MKNPLIDGKPDSNRVKNLINAENHLIVSGSEFPACELMVWSLDLNIPIE